MHPYAIDSNERTLIPLYIAIASVLVALLFQTLFDFFHFGLPWWIEAPSVFALYGLFYTLFDKYVWKWKLLKKIGAVKTPNLGGNWKGQLISSYEDSKIHEANIRILQRWTKISIVLETEFSSSCSLVAGMVIENPVQNMLIYEFLNEPKPSAKATMHIHRGTATLKIQADEKKFTGEYYSGRDRENFGELAFEREK